MNEFVAKKIGEVLAFTVVGNDTINQGRNALMAELGIEVLQDMEDKNNLHGAQLRNIAEEWGVLDTTLAKAEKTAEKLKKMRDLYVADQWDNATELFEWSGFFEGAAIVHWGLVRGAAQTLNHEVLLTLAEEAVTTHYELLEKMVSELESVGQEKGI